MGAVEELHVVMQAHFLLVGTKLHGEGQVHMHDWFGCHKPRLSKACQHVVGLTDMGGLHVALHAISISKGAWAWLIYK